MRLQDPLLRPFVSALAISFVGIQSAHAQIEVYEGRVVVERVSYEAQDDLPPAEEDPAAEEPARNWGPEQATGEPDTPGAGDISTAWASKTEDGQEEWLELEYEGDITPTVVIIHETYNPGAVCKLVTYTETGMHYVLWEGKDPVKEEGGRGIAEIEVQPVMKITKLRVYIDSENVPGWNEIDAVGIKDVDGTVHWAKKATASSTYADLGGGGIGGGFGGGFGGIDIFREPR